MKKLVKSFALFVAVLALTSTVFAQTSNVQLSPTNANLQNITAVPNINPQVAIPRITGSITFPKSLGLPNNFIASVQARMKAYKYDFQNGQLVNQQLLNNLSVSITNVTAASASYYKFNYVLSGTMPYNKPIVVFIGDFCVESCGGLGGIHMLFSTNPQTLTAIITSADKTFENYNFTAVKQAIPY